MTPSLVHWLMADHPPGRDAAPCDISKTSAAVRSSVGLKIVQSLCLSMGK